MAYASALLRDPAATYRQIDVVGRTAGADGPALVQLLYEELVAALRAAAWAAEHRRFAQRGDRVQRATVILFALDAGLDFEAGGDVSRTLATLYAGARATLLKAALGHDPAPFHTLADTLAEIAAAWRQARAA
ncbi:flagellar protein FliS [Sphingomonas bacterium]|uniref:flagellar protein FliS n=1 Tax=Sphingomonas bacterium TaxID=1895847 RepID=UPI0015763D99|nr:flagellar protein FliS [Sphingomonas bacterium]